MTIKKATVIIHNKSDVLGSLPSVLKDMDIHLDVISVDQTLPDPESSNMFFVMGSPESAHDDTLPWIANELRWLKTLLDLNKPVIGICFGSQIIARAMGGKAYMLDEPEIGFVNIHSVNNSWHHQGPWLNFHFDTFDIPDQAELLGITDKAKQAYRKGNCWAVQFHPEIDTAMFDTWTAYWTKTKTGKAFLAENAKLVDDIRFHIDKNEELCRKNFKNLLTEFIQSLGD